MSPKTGALVTVLYRRTPTFTFDTSYYLSTHVPLFTSKWAPHGLLKATVSETVSDPEFVYEIVTEWETVKGYEDALKDEEELKVIMDDVKNFTNGTPVFVVAKVLN